MAVGNEAFFLKRVKKTEKVIAEKQRQLKTWKERWEKEIAEKQQQLKTWKERLETKRKEQASSPVELDVSSTGTRSAGRTSAVGTRSD